MRPAGPLLMRLRGTQRGPNNAGADGLPGRSGACECPRSIRLPFRHAAATVRLLDALIFASVVFSILVACGSSANASAGLGISVMRWFLSFPKMWKIAH